jgi:cytochrome c oxidase subunit II
MAMNDPIEMGSFWLPRARSTLAQHVDSAWDAALWTSIAFFVLVAGGTVLFAIKYRRRTEKDKTSDISHNTTIEVAWTVIPLIIVMGLFGVAMKGYMFAMVAPAEAYEINVTAGMYLWTFTYPNGNTTVNELGVPKGRPVKIILSSQDILHSFYIPEFRVKQDVVPGAYTTLWFEATDAGETTLLCTEYCGVGHSNMLAKVKILEASDFDKWLEGNDDPSAARRARQAAVRLAVVQHLPLAGRHPHPGPQLQGPLRPRRGARGRLEGRRGRELHPRQHPQPAGAARQRIPRDDAGLQGAPEGQGHRRPHRLHQDPQVSAGDK